MDQNMPQLFLSCGSYNSLKFFPYITAQSFSFYKPQLFSRHSFPTSQQCLLKSTLEYLRNLHQEQCYSSSNLSNYTINIVSYLTDPHQLSPDKMYLNQQKHLGMEQKRHFSLAIHLVPHNPIIGNSFSFETKVQDDLWINNVCESHFQHLRLNDIKGDDSCIDISKDACNFSLLCFST